MAEEEREEFEGFIVPRKGQRTVWTMQDAIDSFNAGDDHWCLHAMDCYFWQHSHRGYIPCHRCIYSSKGDCEAKRAAFVRYVHQKGFGFTAAIERPINLIRAGKVLKLLD